MVSTALKVTSSAVVSLTEKEAWPLLPVVTEPGVMPAVVDGEALSVTALPATGLVPSSRVTVTVPVGCGLPIVDTSGVVVVTVESAGETVSVPKVTMTLWPVRGTLSDVSVAV